MANLEIEGRLVQKLGIQSGRSARGDWSKQEFIVEYKEGNFPSTACFNVWGADKVRELEAFQVGDMVRVSFNVSSREFNGRWYTDLRAWRIAPQTQQAPVSAPVSAGAPAGGTRSFPGEDVPAGFAPAAPTLDDMPGESDFGDDLPF